MNKARGQAEIAGSTLATASEVPSSISIATHYYTTGPAFDLEDYLAPRSSSLLIAAHPLYGDGRSFYRQYDHGTVTARGGLPTTSGPRRFVLELARTVRWCSRSRIRTQTFIAADSFLALAGLWLRRTKRARKVIFYSIDYVPHRFPDPVRNALYHRIDSFVAREADVVWNVSDAIAAARERRNPDSRKSPQITVPVGAHFHRIARLPLAQADASCIAFLGHLTEKQGLQLMIRSLPQVRRAVPNATLLVVGDGPYRSHLERLTEECGVAKAVRFVGMVQDHRAVEELLVKCAIAVAPYAPDPLSFTRFADPGKIKNYLACGIPVVTTDVPQIAHELQGRGAGCISPYAEGALAEILIGYLTDSEKLEYARRAATEFGANFSWDQIFDSAWARTARIVTR